MRIVLAITALVLAAGCGKEIGDACVLSSDCSPNGDRQCDTSSREGYCTIPGCDFDTCPEEAVCVRFFTGTFDIPCTAHSECSLDEMCSLKGFCVSRSSEVRYCMRTCEDDSDCRDSYQCRDIERMKMNGGEPVLAPGLPIDGSSPKFCAAAPVSF